MQNYFVNESFDDDILSLKAWPQRSRSIELGSSSQLLIIRHVGADPEWNLTFRDGFQK